MNNLLRELETLQITGNFSEDGLWSACNDLIQKTYVPQKTVGNDRPCEETDYREYRLIVERNLHNIKSMLEHIIHGHDSRNMQIDYSSTVVKTFAVNLLLLIGEQHEKNVWNTMECVSISKELVNRFLDLYQCQTISVFLIQEDNLTTLLLTLRPKLLKETWKHYPAAVAAYKWIIHEVEKPFLYNHIHEVLPTALIIVDDYIPENVVIGLKCLHQIIQHSHMRKGLIDTGYITVMFHALERFTHLREAKYIPVVYSCLTYLLATIEHWETTSNVFEWTKRDDVLAVLLDNMECEQNVELRCVYMMSLPQLLTNLGCAKWSERLTRILSDYCQHHTDLRTLKATLETAKAFLLMCHLRVATHCVPLYTAFLKLHFDLKETPVFDKEIVQNLEDCICLLYKLSPNIGCAIMNNDQMRSVIKGSLQVLCSGDIKYFE